MSTTLTQATATSAPTRNAAHKVTFRRVLRSEWAKTWTLRSTWITLTVGLVLLVLFGLLSAANYAPAGTGHRHGSDASDAVAVALGGTDFAQLALGVLGVLIAAGEYSTGMIRSTLAAVPTRLPMLWSKALTFGAVALVVGSVGAVVSFLGGSGFLHGDAISLGIGSSGVLRSLLGAGVYLGLVGVLGVALGTLLRSIAGGIGALVAVLMLLGLLTDLLPTRWGNDISPYLPGNAGGSVFALHQASNTLSPAGGLAVFAGWVVLALAGAAWRLKKSDA
ncbi:ABC transporter permease [Actinospica durhamensis]|uniref:ABC transporter permease n=1 Tax=Actinospica durhamensis TaxID=1508375 RepID=A0A941EVT1_9ACTN|nr:ABC transporter permease [Actinospica durhamensis]MBR7834844.1 ABC transporter permease [Actinospica durhamensis]